MNTMCSISAVVFHSKRQEMVESEQYDLIVTSRKESESGSFLYFHHENPFPCVIYNLTTQNQKRRPFHNDRPNH